MKVPLERVLQCPIPKLVIPHYPERFLPTARVVPNILPDADPAYAPTDDEARWDVVYTPSWRCGAWKARWDTKGMPETLAMLDRLTARTGCQSRWIIDEPLEVVLRAKRQARVVIDELVTGSYHLSGLEGLCFGKATLAYLDPRSLAVLSELTGSGQCPFVNARLEDAEEVLVRLVTHPDEARAVGQLSRAWFERHWTARRLARHYVEVYEQLLEDPTLVGRQPSLRCEEPAMRFFAVELPDGIHRARRAEQEERHSQKRKIEALEANVQHLSRQMLPQWIKRAVRQLSRVTKRP
jgi:hypothetical protein